MIKKAAIIGGGISGLAAALFALRKGYAVELYEKEDRLGGFAAAFDFDGLSIEKYYHFICGGDTRLISLVEELGLGPALRFRPVTTANFYQGRLFDFASPFDLLAFRPMPLLSRLRFGWHISTAKYLKNWSSLDRMTAKAWLCRRIGLRAYQAVWEPLLNIKFGPYAEHISAAWIWHRIHRAASSRKHLLSREKMGYLEGGSPTLIAAMAAEIRARGGRIHLGAELRGIRKNEGTVRLAFRSAAETGFAKIVLALPLPITARLISESSPDYSAELARIPFLAIVCGVFRLTKKVTRAFWLNINDPRLFCSGFIEYTNLNPLAEPAGGAILYIPFYVGTDHEYWGLSGEALEAEFFQFLQAVNPSLRPSDIRGFRIWKELYAQAVCGVGFRDIMPAYATPLDNTYLLDSSQLYPADRNLDALIRNAENLVNRYF